MAHVLECRFRARGTVHGGGGEWGGVRRGWLRRRGDGRLSGGAGGDSHRGVDQLGVARGGSGGGVAAGCAAVGASECRIQAFGVLADGARNDHGSGRGDSPVLVAESQE